MLGVAFAGLFAFQAQANNVPVANGSIGFSFPEIEVLTFEYSLGTLRVPAHLIPEQGHQRKQILYVSVVNTPLVSIYEPIVVPYNERANPFY